MTSTKSNSSRDGLGINFVREGRVNYVPTKIKQFKITGPRDVARFVRSVMVDNSREQFIALYLDGSHSVAAYAIVSIGSANFAQIHPREIFQRAFLVGATAIAIAHNHPSNNEYPSIADINVTKRLIDAAILLGTKLLDHIIVTDESCYSLREEQSHLWPVEARP